MKASIHAARCLAATALLACSVLAMPAATAAADEPGAAAPVETASAAPAELTFAHARMISLEEGLELGLVGEAMRAAIDPETGELRAQTMSEMAGELRASRAASGGRKATAPAQIALADGTVAERVSPELFNYSVVTIAADGSVVYSCAEGDPSQPLAASPAPAVREVK